MVGFDFRFLVGSVILSIVNSGVPSVLGSKFISILRYGIPSRIGSTVGSSILLC